MIDVLDLLTVEPPYQLVDGEVVIDDTTIHSPAQIIRQLLVDLGMGEWPGEGSTWPAYATAEPNLPDRCITVIDTTGQEDPRIFPTGEAPVHHGIQIIVRSDTHEAGFIKAYQVRNEIATNVKNQDVSIGPRNYCVVALVKISQILPLGKERQVPTSRSRFSINALTPIRRKS